jgi:hypothetical protein
VCPLTFVQVFFLGKEKQVSWNGRVCGKDRDRDSRAPDIRTKTVSIFTFPSLKLKGQRAKGISMYLEIV